MACGTRSNAEQAVRAALAVIEAVAEAPVGTASLQVRIGIATGLVVVGEPIGAGEALQQTAIGRTPNLAARLQGAAQPGCLVIDAATRRQIGSLFQCQDAIEPVHEVHNKPGFADPWLTDEQHHTTRATLRLKPALRESVQLRISAQQPP